MLQVRVRAPFILLLHVVANCSPSACAPVDTAHLLRFCPISNVLGLGRAGVGTAAHDTSVGVLARLLAVLRMLVRVLAAHIWVMVGCCAVRSVPSICPPRAAAALLFPFLIQSACHFVCHSGPPHAGA